MTDKLQDFGHTFQIKSIASLMKNQTFLEQIHDILDEKHYDSDSLKWIIKECKNNPIEMLTDMFAITTIFAFGYALLMLGSILGLN